MVDMTQSAILRAIVGVGHARSMIDHLAKIDEASVRLAMVVEPAGLTAAMAEVERREKLFTEIRTGSPRSGEIPRLAALRSVYEDAINGRMS